ncbi:MAG: hypothetical protein ACOX6T_12340 [Myxococcales bacterium]|jgi:hypothetical protein
MVRWRVLFFFAAAAMFARPAAARDEGPEVIFSLRGGLGGLTGDFAPLTSPGLQWGAQAVALPEGLLGAEANYEGSSNGLQGLDGSVVRNALQAVGRLYTTPNREAAPRPYLAGGIGLGFYRPTRDAGPFIDDDTVVELPLAVGLEWNQGVFVGGVRATFTPLFFESFANDLAPNAQGGYFAISGSVGASF